MKNFRVRRHLLSLTLTAFIAIGGLTACGVAVPPASSINAPPVEAAGPAESYKLFPGDTVKVTVYGEETLTGEYPVDQRGKITIPLAGEVTAGGLTKEELQNEISEVLIAGDYFSEPSVTVDFVSLRPFYILGEVNAPGGYAYQPSLDVLQAIALGGGYTPRAARGKILIDRGTGEARQRLNAGENTPVLPGDSITVRERIF